MYGMPSLQTVRTDLPAPGIRTELSKRQSGIQFDPNVVNAILQLLSEKRRFKFGERKNILAHTSLLIQTQISKKRTLFWRTQSVLSLHLMTNFYSGIIFCCYK
jgi:hypothetical protein